MTDKHRSISTRQACMDFCSEAAGTNASSSYEQQRGIVSGSGAAMGKYVHKRLHILP